LPKEEKYGNVGRMKKWKVVSISLIMVLAAVVAGFF